MADTSTGISLLDGLVDRSQMLLAMPALFFTPADTPAESAAGRVLILASQKLMNQAIVIPRLKEDGLWGTNTKNAMIRFAGKDFASKRWYQILTVLKVAAERSQTEKEADALSLRQETPEVTAVLQARQARQEAQRLSTARTTKTVAIIVGGLAAAFILWR